MSIFGFMDAIGTYEERKVARWPDNDGWIVDTARATDLPDGYEYETAVQHPDYNDGDMVIVEEYATEDEAMAGHERWVAVMDGELPETLTDVSSSVFAQMLRSAGDGMVSQRNTGE